MKTARSDTAGGWHEAFFQSLSSWRAVQAAARAHDTADDPLAHCVARTDPDFAIVDLWSGKLEILRVAPFLLSLDACKHRLPRDLP